MKIKLYGNRKYYVGTTHPRAGNGGFINLEDIGRAMQRGEVVETAFKGDEDIKRLLLISVLCDMIKRSDLDENELTNLIKRGLR